MEGTLGTLGGSRCYAQACDLYSSMEQYAVDHYLDDGVLKMAHVRASARGRSLPTLSRHLNLLIECGAVQALSERLFLLTDFQRYNRRRTARPSGAAKGATTDSLPPDAANS